MIQKPFDTVAPTFKDYHANPTELGGQQTYALLEGTNIKQAPIRINHQNAQMFNNQHYGIFLTVNSFDKKRRLKNLARVNAWFVEIDTENKKETLDLLKSKGLFPTLIIESKRGFHIYWVCCDTSFEKTVNSWDRIVKRGLVPFYNSDPKASDICRILRAPGFYHWKDRNNPFVIKLVHKAKVAYTVNEMIRNYPDANEKENQQKEFRLLKKQHPQSGSFWDNVYNLNCQYALEKLSGSDYVNGEIYSFVNNNKESIQIISNGKPTSCWIDSSGRIGSYENGGPSLAQWLNWFHKDYQKVAAIIKEVFPECLPNQMNLF